MGRYAEDARNTPRAAIVQAVWDEALANAVSSRPMRRQRRYNQRWGSRAALRTAVGTTDFGW